MALAAAASEALPRFAEAIIQTFAGEAQRAGALPRRSFSPASPRRVRCGKSAILQTSANATLDQTKMFARQVGEVYRCHGQRKGKADAAGRRTGNVRKCGNSAKWTVPS